MMMTMVMRPQVASMVMLHRVAQRHRLALGVAVAIGHEQAERDQRDAEQQAGHDAGHEQADDRDGAAGRQRIDHRVVARRHHDRLQRGADGDVGGEDARIADLFHLRDHHRADRRGVGDRGAGNAGEERGGEDVDRRQAAAHPHHADDDIGELDQALRHAAFRHDGAGEHEEGNGEHRHLGDAVGDFQHHRFGRNADPQRADQRAEAERIGDRHADAEAEEQRSQKNEEVHGAPCPSRTPPARRADRRGLRAGRWSGAR